MRKSKMAVLMATAALLAIAVPVSAQSLGQGQAVVTVLPKVEGQPVPSSVTNQDLAVQLNGKNAKVTHWGPYQAPNNQIELVLLIDGAAWGGRWRTLHSL
jgi:hypothetical protein